MPSAAAPKLYSTGCLQMGERTSRHTPQPVRRRHRYSSSQRRLSRSPRTLIGQPDSENNEAVFQQRASLVRYEVAVGRASDAVWQAVPSDRIVLRMARARLLPGAGLLLPLRESCMTTLVRRGKPTGCRSSIVVASVSSHKPALLGASFPSCGATRWESQGQWQHRVGRGRSHDGSERQI